MRSFLLSALALLAAALPAQEALRVWHQDGQTFLLWRNPPREAPASYDIHRTARLDSPITDETLIGRVWADSGENIRMQPLIPGARWRLPLPAGAHILEPGEVCFVHTPDEPGVANYNVVPHGVRTSRPHWRTGLLREHLEDPVKAHVQYSDERVTVYAHWVAGGDPASVEETAEFHGTPHLFAVWEPSRGRGEEPMPAVVALHRMGESFLDMPPERGEPALPLERALLITPDDALRLDRGPGRGRHWVGTHWMGHLENLSPFAPHTPAEDERIVLTTQRRLVWEIEWCIRNLPIDPERVSIIGAGIGANGALLQAFTEPHTISAAAALVPRLEIPETDETAWVFGEERGRQVALGPGMPLWGLFDPMALLTAANPPRLPPVQILFGTGDPGWSRARAMLPRLDAARAGLRLWWDERSRDHWTGAHWRREEALTAQALTQHERGAPLLAFNATDSDPETAGRQPSPEAAAWGTWGGDIGINGRALRDREDEFQAQLWSKDAPRMTVDLTLLGRTRFLPEPGARLRWLLWRRADRRSIASGYVEVGEDGSIVLPGLELLATPLNLQVDVSEPVDPALLPFRAD